MAMKLDQIARQALDALARDYAGMPECDDGLGRRWQSAFEAASRSKILYDKLFYQYMTQRLACLQDHNLCFIAGPNCSYAPEDCGFDVRRHGEGLYVTRVRQETRLQVGDVFESVNKQSLDECLAHMVGNQVNGDDPDRQLWGAVLTQATHGIVRHADGSVEDFRIRRFPLQLAAHGPCSCVTLDDGDCLLTVTQLDTGEIGEVIAAHRDELRAAGRLVIDLRTCSGGTEACAHPLLDYLFDDACDLAEIEDPEAILTNYTEANCDRREAQIAQLRTLAAAHDDEQTRSTLSWLDDNLQVIRANRGKGYVEETVQPDSHPIQAAPTGQRVLILTDVTTADAAEWLVRLARTSARVTVVGRATSGNLDYANPLAMAFEDRFILVYPMSKTKDAAEGRGMRGTGILPDHHVPFMPEECTRDVILQHALAL